MEYGILLLRVAVGLMVAAHGIRKLAARDVTASSFARIGYRSPGAMGAGVGVAELGGGLLLAAGLLTPVAEALVATVAVMDVARFRRPSLRTVELNLALVAVVVAVTMTGPLRLSVDAALGWDRELDGVAWASGVLGLAILVAFVATTLGRARPEAGELPA
ncbi:MAG: DoxX family membrane protein [Gaiellaceae bacterium]